MKFAFYTTLLIGVINLLFQAFLILGFIFAEEFFSGDVVTRVVQGFFLVIFGISGILLLISAFKIKHSMKFKEETDGFLSGAESFEKMNL